MVEAQARIVAAMQELRDAWTDGEVVLVSHGDIVKAAVAYWLGVPLDLFQRIEIDPGSISRVHLGQGEVTVWGINQTIDFPASEYPASSRPASANRRKTAAGTAAS
jgi:probable phosphoglycerate mutase